MSNTQVQAGGHVGPNMTPMVDIVLCILIFFMLSCTFASAEIFLTNNLPIMGMQPLPADVVKIPEAKLTVEFRKKEGVTEIRLDHWPADSFMRVGKPDTAPDEAAKQKEQEYNQAIYVKFKALRDIMGEDTLVILKPNAEVPFEDLIKVYDACVRAQIAKVAFARQ